MISVSLQCKIVSLGEQQEKRDFKRQQPQQPAQSFYLSPNQIRSWQLGAVINELYNSYPNITNEGTFEIDGIIDKVLRDIYEQKTDETVNKDLFNFTNNTISKAITEGTTTLADNVQNTTFINQLKTSGGVFSAFKVHHQHKAIAALLLDEKGNTIPFAQFKKAALKISDHQNKSWLKTEYNTAKRRAAIGAKFTKFKETAHLYPNLKWTPSRSNNPDGNHQQLWGITLPVEHPFWASNFPGNRWNCKCGIQRTKAATTGSDDVPTTENPPKGLDGNPAFTKEIIAKSHPVFKGLSKAEEKAALKVVTKQVKKDVIEFSTQLIKDKYGSIILTNKKLSDGKLTLRRGVFKTLGAKVTDPFINTYPLILQNDIQNWEYLGYAEIEDENKHLDAYYFSYYKTSYGGRTIYINVKDTIKEGEVPYNILYRFDKKKVIEKKLPKIKRRFVRKR